MRKYFRFLLPLALAVLNLVFLNRDVSAWFGIPENPRFYLVFVALAFVCCYQWLDVFRPLQEYERFRNKRFRIFDEIAGSLLETYLKHPENHQLRMNIMCSSLSWVTFLEPRDGNPGKRRIRFFRRKLKIVWSTDNMNYKKDRRLELTSHQGISGEAFRSGALTIGDLAVNDPASYNLNKEQMDSTRDLQFVLSCPIFRMDKGTGRLSPRGVVGVVNIDSVKPGDDKFVTDDDHNSELSVKIQGISEFCSEIL